MRLARELAGFRSAADAARALGITESTYNGHENGQRNFTAESAKTYARAFGVNFGWLMVGDGLMKPGARPELMTLFSRMSADHRNKWLLASQLLLEIIDDLMEK